MLKAIDGSRHGMYPAPTPKESRMEISLIILIGLVVGGLLTGSGVVEKNTTRVIRSVKKAAVSYDSEDRKV